MRLMMRQYCSYSNSHTLRIIKNVSHVYLSTLLKTILLSWARWFTLPCYFIASLSKWARYKVSFVNVQSMSHAVHLPFRCSMWFDGIIGRVIWRPEWITHSNVVYCLLPVGLYYITSTHTYDNVSLRDTFLHLRLTSVVTGGRGG